MPEISLSSLTLEKTCRLCLSHNGVLSAIFLESFEEPERISLPDKIKACVDVEVSKGDELPYQICHRCLYQVERSYDFKEQCQKSDKVLRDFAASKTKQQKECGITYINSPSQKSEYHEENLKSENVTVLEDDGTVEEDIDVDDDCEDEEEFEEESEADKALVESLAKCPDLRIVHQPCDSSLKAMHLVVDEPRRHCNICGSSFANQQLLGEHVGKHNADGLIFSCEECFQTFGDRVSFEEHSKTHKTAESDGFSSVETMQDHLKNQTSFFNCPDCDQTFMSVAELSKHAVVHSSGGLRPFKCQICPKEFSRTTNLNKHMRVHSGQRPYSCGECPKMFRTRGDMLRHQIIHTGQKPFSCSVCLISFNRKDKLTRHERLHSTDKPFACSFCSMTFIRRDDLSRHSLIHLNIPVKEETEQLTATDLRVACKQESEPLNQDDASTDGEARLTIVEDSEEPPEKTTPSTPAIRDTNQERTHADTSNPVESMVINVDPFQVNSQTASCDSSTSWPHNLSVNKNKTPNNNETVQETTKPYTCDVCNKAFSDKSYMKTHQLTHLGVRPHACGYCGKAFFRRRELLRHEAVHTGVKPFQCKICQKAFARSDKLMRHERTHSNVQQYACSYCPAKFVRKDDLTRHEMSHTGQKPHACSCCSKTFATKAELTRHEKTHAAKVVKEFKCELCLVVFPRKDKLTAHMRSHDIEMPMAMPLLDGVVDLRGLMALKDRISGVGSGVAGRTIPMLGQNTDVHLVPLKQN